MRRKILGAAAGALGVLAAIVAACTGGAPAKLAPSGFEAVPGGTLGAAPAVAPAGGVTALRTAGATVGGAKDIGWAREVIERGGIPDPRAITVEGLYSESDLPLEGTAARDLFSLDLGTGVAEGAWLVQIGLSSHLDLAEWRRAPLNVCAVVDVSGSMASDAKMEATKHALKRLAARLDERDVLSIVAFNHQAWVVVKPAPVRDREALERAIAGLGANGSTNMYAGLTLGYTQIAASGGAKGGRTARAILFTDALPNTGMFTGEGFVSLASEYGREGIGLTAFGVGIDFGHDLARKIAECPGGNYRFLRNRAEIEGVFEADFDFLVTPIAYDLALEVAPAPGFEVVETFGFPGGGLKVATVFLSRNRGALALRLRPTGAVPASDPLELCRVTLSYRKETDGSIVRESLAAAAPPVAPGAERFSHRGVRKTLALTMLAIAMRDACAPDRSPAAVARLEHAHGRAEREAQALEDADLAREARLAAKLVANLHAQMAAAPAETGF